MGDGTEARGDVTEEDIGKPIFTAEEHKVGTLRGMNGPTLHISLAEDMDPELHSDIKISEISGIKDGDTGEYLATAARASVEGVTDDEIHFWPTYAAEAGHESVDYDEIPGEDSNVALEDS
jgi:hypothetical protein